jgi:hypothetical protein
MYAHMGLARRLGLIAVSLAVVTPTVVAARHNTRSSKDLIVIGTIENLAYEHVDVPDDMLGHGWITARLHVVRVVEGKSPSSTLTVRYFAHTYMYGDRELRFHLRLGRDGTYAVCTESGEGVRCR